MVYRFGSLSFDWAAITKRPQQRLRPDDIASLVYYWPVLGLVDGPGVELGVGLVVLGVSVPVPPMLEPLFDAPPDVPWEPMLPEVPEVPDELGEVAPPGVR